jgi:hypothetical protein
MRLSEGTTRVFLAMVDGGKAEMSRKIEMASSCTYEREKSSEKEKYLGYEGRAAMYDGRERMIGL